MPGRFFDTNVLLYLLSEDRTKADIAEGLLRDGGTVSVQVLNEIANVTQRKFRMNWAQSDEFLLMIREFVTVEPLTWETHDLGIALARKHSMAYSPITGYDFGICWPEHCATSLASTQNACA